MVLGFVRSTVELLTVWRGIAPPTHVSSSLQIDSDDGFWSLRMEVDDFSGYSGFRPEVKY